MKELNFIYKLNKIFQKKSKIKIYLHNIRESKYTKKELILHSLDKITLNLSKDKNAIQTFCPFKGEVINYKKNGGLEKFIIFISESQINLLTELFIDGTFKISPKNWCQLFNIFG